MNNFNFLIDKCPGTVSLNGVTYDIKTDHITGLQISEILLATDLTDQEKVYAIISTYLGPYETWKHLPIMATYRALMSFYRCDYYKKQKPKKDEKKDKKQDEKKAIKPRSIDYVQDAIYIYAAFKQIYNIDLSTCEVMHWWKFNAMLRGLPPSTKLSSIIDIRLRRMPARTKYNGEYVDNLTEAKELYALDQSEDYEKQQNRHKMDALDNVILTWGGEALANRQKAWREKQERKK